MSEKHLRQLGFTYSACGSFTKNKERTKKKKKETVDSRCIYRNKIDENCFQHDMDFRGFKDLSRRTASDKVSRDKAFNIAKNSKYQGNHCGLASMVYKFFDKNPSGGNFKSEIV